MNDWGVVVVVRQTEWILASLPCMHTPQKLAAGWRSLQNAEPEVVCIMPPARFRPTTNRSCLLDDGQ